MNSLRVAAASALLAGGVVLGAGAAGAQTPSDYCCTTQPTDQVGGVSVTNNPGTPAARPSAAPAAARPSVSGTSGSGATLPFTGSDVTGLVVTGTGAVIAGSVLAALARRRRSDVEA